MAAHSHIRFLLRAACLLLLSLAVWWVVLKEPMLNALRLGTQFGMEFLPGDGAAARATISPDGNWLMQIPLPSWVAQLDSTQRIFGHTAPDSPPIRIRSLKLPIESTYPVIFLAGFPVFWAVWFAAPRAGASWKNFAIANGILAVVSVLSLVFYSVHTANTMLHLPHTGLAEFFWSTGKYLVINVVPYTAPLLLAIWYHPGLQAFILSGGNRAAQPAAGAKVEAPRHGRRARSRTVKQ